MMMNIVAKSKIRFMKSLIIYFILFVQAYAYTQNTEEKSLSEENLPQIDSLIKPEEILEENSMLACKCIDSIPAVNRSTIQKAEQVKNCIDKQVIGYQSTLKLSEIDYKNVKDSLTVEINVNPESKEYKKYYYSLERDLMDNCPALKILLGSNDMETENSFSKNPEAIKAYNKGIKYLNENNFQEALPYFQKAVEADDSFAFAWDNIGVIQRNLENYKEAIKAYKKSISLNSSNRTPLQNLALVYMFQKKYKKAIKAYEKLGELDENNPEVFYGIANAYIKLGEYENSLDNMCKAYNLYIAQNSPYRSDAEKMINMLYKKFKSDDKEDRFKEILESNNINY